VLLTIQVRIMLLDQIFPFPIQGLIAGSMPEGAGVAVSAKPPPRAVLDKFPQMGTLELPRRNSTATKHFTRIWRRRSWLQDGVNKSGSNGGVAAGLVATGLAPGDCGTAAECASARVVVTFEAAVTLAGLLLILR